MTDYELAKALFPKASDIVAEATAGTHRTTQVRGWAATPSAGGEVTVLLDTEAGGDDAKMVVPTSGGIIEGGEVLVTLLDGTPVDCTQPGSVDAIGSQTVVYITGVSGGVMIHPANNTTGYNLLINSGGIALRSNSTELVSTTTSAFQVLGANARPEHGSVGESTTVASGGYADVGVTFSHAYASAPSVIVGLLSTDVTGGAGSASVAVKSVTTTGFTARLFNASSSSLTLGFHWIALG